MKKYQLAAQREKESFQALAEGDLGTAKTAFQAAKNAYPTYHNVAEISGLLAEKAPAAVPEARGQVTQTVIRKYAWGAPPGAIEQLKQRRSGQHALATRLRTSDLAARVCGSVLVRLISRDDAKQAAAAEAFVAKGAWVSHLVLAETTWVLSAAYDLSAAKIAIAVEMLLNHRDLALPDPDVVTAALDGYGVPTSVVTLCAASVTVTRDWETLSAEPWPRSLPAEVS